jgi:hypothetical protein
MKAIASVPLFLGLLLLPAWAICDDTSPRPAVPPAPKSGDVSTADATADQSAEPNPADAANVTRRKNGLGATSIAIISRSDGQKSLTIHFPWSLYPDSSIEVRLVPDAEGKGIEVTPIYFHEHLNGKVRDDFYDCLDHTENGGKTHNFTKDKLVYTMIGRRNSLGNQGVHVEVASETPKKSDMPSVAYLQLDTWAVDKKTLSLDLARDNFARPGTLFVWFFRGDKSVWEEQIRWPGYK